MQADQMLIALVTEPESEALSIQLLNGQSTARLPAPVVAVLVQQMSEWLRSIEPSDGDDGDG